MLTSFSKAFLFVCILGVSALHGYAQFREDFSGKSSLIGGQVGMAFPGGESDPELNCALTYLFHNQVNNGYAFELQTSGLISTAPSVNDGFKFVLPIDSRFFLGTLKFAGFAGAGLQLTYVAPGDQEYMGDKDYQEDEKFTQFAANMAMGMRIGFWKERRHSIVLGTKLHFPIAGSKWLDDKVVVAIIGGIGFTNSWGAIKIDYEYPFGKGYENSVYGINSQALSCSVLFNIRTP